MKYVLIKGDTNDADYAYNLEKIEDPNDLEIIKKLVSAIKEYDLNHKYNGCNWPNHETAKESPEEIYKDVLTEEEICILQDSYIPYNGSDNRIHSIDSIKIFEVSSVEELY